MNALTLIICCLSGGGLLLFVMLIRRIREVGDLQKLQRYRSKKAGVCDLLNYSLLADNGVIACKSGALMAAWTYTGHDLNYSTDEEREYFSSIINRALRGMGDGWMIHVDAVRHPAPRYPNRDRSHFPDPVSAAVDEERRRFFEERGVMYEGHFVLTVTWLPPLLAERKMIELMFDDDSKPDSRSKEYEKLLETFIKSITTLEERLSSVLKLHRLQAHSYMREDGEAESYDDFLQHLNFCITGITHPVQVPACPTYLDALLGGQEFWGGIIPKMGQKFIQVVAIEGFPSFSYPGMLSALTDLDLEYRWSSRFIFLDQQTALSHINKYRQKWNQKKRNIVDVVFNRANGRVNRDAADMDEDAEQALAEVQGGHVAAGYYTSVVVLMDEDRRKVENEALRLQKAIFNLGFAARIETLNTMEAFLGSLPGHGFENVRRPILTTQSLADLLPSSSIWTGSSTNPCPLYPPDSPPLCHCVTTGSSPFRLNLHVRDVGHSIMFGPTGAGKSTALALLAMQMRRYENASIFVFDKGMSMYATTKACGGQHFNIAGEKNGLQFAPLYALDTPQDRTWALDWIDTILKLNGLNTTPGDRHKIAKTLELMHNEGKRQLSDFVGLINVPNIKETMLAYTDSMLLNAEKDTFALSSFTTFEMEELMGLGERWALPILLYLFRRIEKSLHGQPAFIMVDEAWLMLSHAFSREKIAELFRVARKLNCALLLATQNISDAVDSPIWNVLLSQTATKIFLPNFQANEMAETYANMGLNRHQINIISRAVAKREYYLVSENGCRLFNFALGPLALAFAGASDKESVQKIQNLEETYGDEWVSVWLESRGLSLADYQREAA